MTRLQIRPRPLDFNRKLPIIRSVRDFEDDEASTVTINNSIITAPSTRNSQIPRITSEAENEVNQIQTRKSASEIPTPQFVVVDTYERDYSCSFSQPTSYVRGRGARAELGDFVEYDLDNEDEDWLQEFNNERKIITPEKFEALLFRLEVLDHKTRERGGVIISLGSPVPVVLQLDAAAEALAQNMRYAVFQSIYNYWKAKRERWQKPILRRIQPPPPVNDTNPYNVFRPREKAHRLHTRRMQRRENNVQSFDKLRQVMRNLGQVKGLVETLIKREEKKRELMECEVNLQRIRLKYKHETQLIEDGLALPGFGSTCKLASSDEDFIDSDDVPNGFTYTRPATARLHTSDSMMMTATAGRARREFRRRPLARGWLQKRGPQQPVLLFTRRLDQQKLAAAGIVRPADPPTEDGDAMPTFKFHGRIGRGGRIIFDRWNPFTRTPFGHESSSPTRNAQPSPPVMSDNQIILPIHQCLG
ncbi:enhancer of polycomb-like protein 1 [Nymphaea colorata]|nr:enhancer of polycomb-like protein 1 [Nymphaea colorata]